MNQQLQQHEETVEKTSWFARKFGRKHVSEVVEADTETVVETVSEEAKVAELRQATRQRQKSLRTFKIALLVALLAFFTAVFGSMSPLFGGRSVFEASGKFLFFAFLFSTLGVGFSAYCIGLVNMVRGMKRLIKAVTALTDTNDVHAVGPLIEAWRFNDFAQMTSATVAVALNRLLPRLQACDTNTLDDKQRDCLYRALRASANPRSLKHYNLEFAVTILRALEQIGDGKAIPVVERLAQRKAKSSAQKRLQQAAQECLPFLKARLESVDGLQPALVEAREETKTTFSSLQVESLDALMTQFTHAARAGKRNFRIAVGSASIGFSTIMISAIAAPFTHASSVFGLPFAFGGMGTIFLGEFLLASSLMYMGYTASRTRGVANALSNTDDLRVVGPLAEALEMKDMYVLKMAVGALTRLLPRLRASDAGLLNDQQRHCLCRVLNRTSQFGWKNIDKQSADFLVAVLKALEQIGDGSALPFVERLATMKAKTPMQRRVQEAALSCLPFLQERAEHQRAEEILLRASTESVTPPEILLRPAANVPVIETETLLRPGPPNE